MNVSLNEPKTIVFHPGIGKTATSAIQNIGLKLSTKNEQHACFSPFGVIGGAHNLLASNHPLFSPFKFKEEWESLLDFALQRDSSTIVSSEFLIRDNPKHIENMLKQATDKGVNVKVIIAVRNYTDYLVSAFLQAVKVNWGIPENENMFMFCERELAQVRMPVLVDHWAKHIGDENIFLMDYDENKNDFVNLFFESLGINLPPEYKKDEKVNTSIKLEIAPMLRHFDRVSNDQKQRLEVIQYLNSLDYKDEYATNLKGRIAANIVRNTFVHDKERLSARYTWI